MESVKDTEKLGGSRGITGETGGPEFVGMGEQNDEKVTTKTPGLHF